MHLIFSLFEKLFQMVWFLLQLFFDAENDFAVIGLEGCPVISGDVKVRFESRTVSIVEQRLSISGRIDLCICWYYASLA